MVARARRATGKLLGVEATPRVLPYAECLGVVLNVFVDGRDTPGADGAPRSCKVLRATDCCTHKNVALRSLAEVPVLARSRGGEPGLRVKGGSSPSHPRAALGNRRVRVLPSEVNRLSRPGRTTTIRAGSPSSTWTVPWVSRTRRCAMVSPTAAGA